MQTCELLIIGSGPAGTSAAIYAARSGIETKLIGCRPKYAGEYDIDNYYGFPETISGKELQKRGLQQAERFGVEADCDRALAVHVLDNNRFRVKTETREIEACALLLATGVSRTKPGISNLSDYEGKGVSYCVSCDGFFVRGRPVMVLGEGNFAANQAFELMDYTDKVTICTQGKAVGMHHEYLDRLAQSGIEVIEQKIVRLTGDPALEEVVFEDDERRAVEGLFIAQGQASSSDFAYTLGLERDGVFIKADNEQNTSMPGVFAAGDCTGGFLQISVAVGEGAKAAKSAIEYVKRNCR
ncbi:NAD(P)/FAD-dependent oxidoreductase [Desulfohalovibrio reitneri]|uniref:NAD(P)/FAD-dependent oxidoreductase n=1 Tax=Desulfohalovibrio reitneri TaxID=1307759 RepID=UPI0004A78205|nr:NAD(P)/FAD-dependent oxidoreductase [Desulfohalovibrio reitneri]